MVHDPREFPGVHRQQVVDAQGTVIESRHVINIMPSSSAIWRAIHPGDVVFYPNDPSSNMLEVRSGADTLHWYEDPALAQEIFDAEFGEYPGLYEE